MAAYKIFTDSSSDLGDARLVSWGVPSLSLTFRFTDSETEYKNADMPIGEFYDHMKAGRVAKTAAVSVGSFSEAFEAILKDGKDILYIGFSSGLSTTYQSAVIAARELLAKYPERKILCVDSLCASAGLGLLVSLALDAQARGEDIESVSAMLEQTKSSVCHWFTVEDLVYLKRGGRVSPTAAFVGNMLGIKPVMHVDGEGHLVNVTKVRGRRASIAALADRYTNLALTPDQGRVYISHAACAEDARLLSDMIESRHGVKTEIITDVGPVIGAHSGPGTLALFFLGKER